MAHAGSVLGGTATGGVGLPLIMVAGTLCFNGARTGIWTPASVQTYAGSIVESGEVWLDITAATCSRLLAHAADCGSGVAKRCAPNQSFMDETADCERAAVVCWPADECFGGSHSFGAVGPHEWGAPTGFGMSGDAWVRASEGEFAETPVTGLAFGFVSPAGAFEEDESHCGMFKLSAAGAPALIAAANTGMCLSGAAWTSGTGTLMPGTNTGAKTAVLNDGSRALSGGCGSFLVNDC